MSPQEAKEKAQSLFLQGYTCSSSVLCAFCNETGLSFETAAKISCGFGAGMGRQRLVCGAFSGLLMAFDMLHGSSSALKQDEKAHLYGDIQELGRAFEKKNGSLICSKLLGLPLCPSSPVPEKRTFDYYKKRPCKDIIGNAAYILAEYLLEKNKCKDNIDGKD